MFSNSTYSILTSNRISSLTAKQYIMFSKNMRAKIVSSIGGKVAKGTFSTGTPSALMVYVTIQVVLMFVNFMTFRALET